MYPKCVIYDVSRFNSVAADHQPPCSRYHYIDLFNW